MTDLIDESTLSRFEVIDHRHDGVGRIITAYCEVHLEVQDDGRTLKVFLTDKDRAVRI